VAVAFVLFAWARSAQAHTVGLSNGHYVLDGRTVHADLAFAQRELVMLLPELDADHDGELDRDELAAGGASVARLVVTGVTVSADGTACPGTLERAWPLEGENGVVVSARYTCPSAPRRLSFAWPLLTAPVGLAPGHRHVASISTGGPAENVVLDGANATWSRDVAGGAGATMAGGLFWSMLKLGVEHILTGWDHLLFLLGLVVVGGRWRSLVGVVSAFTIAHSITLALAAMGVFAPSPRVIEPLIALSIAYVGVENFFVADASRRWRITFPFGLIHGFGFAGALREIALPSAQVPVALVSFNLGVEAGQLGVLALVLPLLALARRFPQFDERATRSVSFAIAASGFVLFVFRVVKSS
jgi:hypothetical protein